MSPNGNKFVMCIAIFENELNLENQKLKNVSLDSERQKKRRNYNQEKWNWRIVFVASKWCLYPDAPQFVKCFKTEGYT